MSDFYQKGLEALMNGDESYIGSDVQLLLLTSGYTFNADHKFVADLTPGSNELTGTGYSRKVLGTKTVAVDDTNNRAVFDAADVLFTEIDAGTAALAVLFFQVTNDADSVLIATITDGGWPIVTSGGDVSIVWDAAGILAL